jgi:hypothetical protein
MLLVFTSRVHGVTASNATGQATSVSAMSQPPALAIARSLPFENQQDQEQEQEQVAEEDSCTLARLALIAKICSMMPPYQETRAHRHATFCLKL